MSFVNAMSLVSTCILAVTAGFTAWMLVRLYILLIDIQNEYKRVALELAKYKDES